MEAGDDPKIKKTIIHVGDGYKPLSQGARVKFHFKTIKCDANRTVIDDSKKFGKPMELVIGKKFKLAVWETMLHAMAVNEVASFVVDKSLLHAYPLVSKTLRDSVEPSKVKSRPCCGQMLQSYELEHRDLAELIKDPCDLEFIFEVLSIENDGEYERDSWQLTEADRLNEVPKLKEEGNQLFKAGKYKEAADKYSLAIGYLDQLMLGEKPGDVEWKQLNDKKLPILLNYAQCKLSLKEYYEVIEHCSTVLQYDPENIKALFRRGKAHASVWNYEEAKKDFEAALKLDPTLDTCINKCLKDIELQIKQKENKLKENLKGKLF
ncbi:hypothetical protein O3M35_010166 [Rhynocoris fuscipes]|uniref:AIP/AIPL N-terminal FKBP-type PPIase domain-containing protein n=1 Tax=Rhynocoris fuscipes TaxID=488301 RepID=A0AAW1D1I7_9HEMI